jgi:hypothetical protein
MTEADLARQVRDLLDALVASGKCFYVRTVSAPTLGREGRLPKGQPDIVGWLRVPNPATVTELIPFAFELKGSKGRLTPEQEQSLEAAIRAGGIAMVVRDVAEVIELLKELRAL